MIYNGFITLRRCGFPFAEIGVASIGMISLCAKSPYLARLCLCFFIGRYLVLEETRLVQRAITVGTQDLYWFGPPKASKSRTSSRYLFVLRSRRIARWRLQDGYAYESFDDYNRGYG